MKRELCVSRRFVWLCVFIIGVVWVAGLVELVLFVGSKL